MNSSRGTMIAAVARGKSKNPAAKFGYLNSSRGKIIVEMARNELKEPTSKSDASGAEANNCLTFDFPECNAVELNDYNNGGSSLEPQIITNLEIVLISIISLIYLNREIILISQSNSFLVNILFQNRYIH
ncbi:hypothetical protein JTB14_003160 [Gonioctena quinquepunctata]|nr:hypothetical protein JTB14_003160 [Gonioctena quinquepunctata]